MKTRKEGCFRYRKQQVLVGVVASQGLERGGKAGAKSEAGVIQVRLERAAGDRATSACHCPV